jgi:hypothetical protein
MLIIDKLTERILNIISESMIYLTLTPRKTHLKPLIMTMMVLFPWIHKGMNCWMG